MNMVTATECQAIIYAANAMFRMHCRWWVAVDEAPTLRGDLRSNTQAEGHLTGW
jgi:hypothetical protein